MDTTEPTTAPTAGAADAPMTVLVTAFDLYQDRLHAFINNHLDSGAWHIGADLAQNVWMRALESADLDDLRVDSHSEMPRWLVEAARDELAEHHRTLGAAYALDHSADGWHDAGFVEDKLVLLPADPDDVTRELHAPTGEYEYALPLAV